MTIEELITRFLGRGGALSIIAALVVAACIYPIPGNLRIAMVSIAIMMLLSYVLIATKREVKPVALLLAIPALCAIIATMDLSCASQSELRCLEALRSAPRGGCSSVPKECRRYQAEFE